MKKIYSVVNGRLMLIILGLSMVLCTSIIMIALPISGLEWLYLILFDIVLFVVPILIFIFKFHCLNYIKISSYGIEHKNVSYSWNDVYITMEVVNAFGGIVKYNYRIFFSENFLTKEEIKKANKKGFWIDLTKDRANCILSYYKKQICDLYDCPKSKGVYQIISEHNKAVLEQSKK